MKNISPDLNKRKKPAKKLPALVFGAALLILSVIAYLNIMLKPVATQEQAEVAVSIPLNTTSQGIGELLQERDLIRSAGFFRLYSRYKKADGQLKAGEYVIPQGLSLPQIIDIMIKGPLDKVIFTVPEGFNLNQLADMLDEQEIASREELYRVLTQDQFEYGFVDHLPAGEKRFEGYLFPDTYTIGSTTSEHVIIDMMLNRFDKKLEELNYLEQLQGVGLTLHQAVTMASMIEREARLEEERTLIAGVIFNRLEIGMPLQIDATIEYALGGPRPKIYYKDLEVDSPYNTYRNTGLPPGPIAFPGEASLKAVLNPDKNDFLYYVARPDGSHAFSRTLAEHNANKSKYIE